MRITMTMAIMTNTRRTERIGNMKHLAFDWIKPTLIKPATPVSW